MRCRPERRSGVREFGHPGLDIMIDKRPHHDRLNPAPDDVAGSLKTQLGISSSPANCLDPGMATQWSSYPGRPTFLPPDLILEPISRKPTILAETTRRAVHNLPAAAAPACRVALETLDRSARSLLPPVSIVVVTRDNLVFSKLCLESVLANTDYPRYELIIVDNGSGDELLSYLDQLADRIPFIRVVRNETNRGFAAANNLGLAQATGDRFVLLNNDTIVPHGWLARLVRHLEESRVGAVGPVTNRAGNEAQIETAYRTYAEFERFARECAHGHAEKRFEIPMLTMFCFAMRRETHERVGPLDDQYHIAMFEDDDYAVRLRSEGYRLVCAEDVFVHHFGGASVGGLLPAEESQELLKANRERFQRKWGITWQPHRRRQGSAYRRLIAGIKEVVHEVIPAGARVLVVSKGDPDLIELEGRLAQHFPQNPDASYTGYHPAESAAAISHLTSLCEAGAEYLVIPSTAFWWLEHYADFAQHLADLGDLAFRSNDLCVIFRIPRPESPK
jgi:GT2 family glycosyltransferase